MNDSDPQSAPPSQPLPLHLRIRYSGVAILFVGLVGAALIYVFAADDSGARSAAEIDGGRLYEYNIERIGGMAAVYAARFNHWLAGLWHGKPLAYTVAVLAVALALLCFAVAGMIFVRLPHAPDNRRED